MVDVLRSRGVEALDGIVVSNPDADPIGEFLDVLDAFEVSTVYLSGDPKGTLRGPRPSMRSCAPSATRARRLIESCAGLRMDWGGTRADVIAPLSDRLYSETNHDSVGILLTHGSARILFAGDAEKKSEEYMAHGPYTAPLAVLKVAHHGSNTSSTPRFLSSFNRR